MLDGIRQYSSDHVEILTHLSGVGHLDSKRQRGPHHWIVSEGPQGLMHEMLGQRETGPDMDTESQVGAHPAECRGCVEIAAGKVEAIARLEQRFHQRSLCCPFSYIGSAVVPRLIVQRRGQHWPMDPPLFLTCKQEDEDVVYVVVSAEALVLWRRDVGVGLNRMTEFSGEPLAELENGRPNAMKGLQHERRAVGKQLGEPVIAHLVGNSGTNAARRGEGLVGQSRAVLGHS